MEGLLKVQLRAKSSLKTKPTQPGSCASTLVSVGGKKAYKCVDNHAHTATVYSSHTFRFYGSLTNQMDNICFDIPAK